MISWGVLQLIGGLILLTAAYLYYERWKANRLASLIELRDRLKNYYEPSRFDGDTEPEKRAIEILEQLLEAGNTFRGKAQAVKVYVIPFRAMDVLEYYLDIDEQGNTGYKRDIIPVDESWDATNEDFLSEIKVGPDGQEIETVSFQTRLKETIKEKERLRAEQVRYMLENKFVDHENKNVNFFLYEYLGMEKPATILEHIR